MLPECKMTKLEALRFIATHFGLDGQESNTFNDLLHRSSDDGAEFTIAHLLQLLDAERQQRAQYAKQGA